MNKSGQGHISVTGGRIWYEIVGHERRGIPLIVLQGGPGASHTYMRHLEVLSDERPVIFYDQLGTGQADRPTDSRLWTIDRYVEELGQVWETLGIEEGHVIGHSWGGMLAVDYALTKPKGLVSLILDSAPLSVPRRIADVAVCRANMSNAIREVLDGHEAAGTMESEEYQQALMAFYQRHVCRTSPWPDSLTNAFSDINNDIYMAMQGPNEFFFTGNLKDYDRTGRLHEIKVPTLFLCGRHGLVPPDTSAWFHSLLIGSELVVFEKSAECAFLEEQERYYQVLRDFILRAEKCRKGIAVT